MNKTLGERIRARRKECRSSNGRPLTQAQLAKGVGVSGATASQWENDIIAPRGANLSRLAKILQCDADWLLYGDAKSAPHGNLSPGPSIQGQVPLISLVQAGNWTEIVDNYQPGHADEWRETTAKVGPHAFALKVKGDSMVNPRGFPSIPEGAIVIVEPDAPADNGKIVVARLEDTTEATLKKLVIDGPNRYLMPLNPDYRPIPINGNCTIVGVVKKVEFDL